jgi:hypothetical protein
MQCRRDFYGKHNQDDNSKPPLENYRHFTRKPLAHNSRLPMLAQLHYTPKIVPRNMQF